MKLLNSPTQIDSRLMDMSFSDPALWKAMALWAWVAVAVLAVESTVASAADGTLTLITRDDSNRASVPARLELHTNTGRRTAVRRTIPSGPGVSLPGKLELPLSVNPYRFKVVRGPEYRVITGNFEIQPSAVDEKVVDLSRMVNMQAEGYLSGDMAAFFPTTNLRLRMATEDLHVAALLDPPPPAPRTGSVEQLQMADKELNQDESKWGPFWHSANAKPEGDLLTYPPMIANDGQPDESTDQGRVAIANPFSIELPLLLASQKVDGIFILGDWLREGNPIVPIHKIRNSRPPSEIGFSGALGTGRYAQSIYWRILEAGLPLVPLAGTGTRLTNPDSAWSSAAIGYNRTYAIGSPKFDDDRRLNPVASEAEYYKAVWAGRSIITNGPLLRPTLGGFAPGHRFKASTGESLEMSVELHLAVRDPVEYLEVIHNGEIFYSARLDEFAKTGGTIPGLKIDKSGWVLVRVVTEHDEHFRAAISAPWFIDFDNQPRISRKAVEFFGGWLNDCENELKKLPADKLARFIEPVRMARQFWRQRLQDANVD